MTLTMNPAADEVEASAQAAAAASLATTATERHDLAMADTLDPGVRPVVYALLLSLVDNKQALGLRYAEWCTGAPILESSVAAAAMTQDEVAHARSLYPLLRGFPEAAGDADDTAWQTRPSNALALLDRPFASWMDFVVANLVVDAALTVVFEAAQESTYEPLRQRALKILQEEEAHATHASGWAKRFLGDAHHGPRFIAAVGAAWEHAATWLGPDDDPVFGALAEGGVLDADPAGLREQLRRRLNDVGEASLSPVLSTSLPWERWTAATRRLA